MGFEISGSTIVDQSRQLLSVGVITATSLDISGNIDVDGHTELDYVNIAGVSTFSDTVEIPSDSKKILLGAEKEMQVFHDGTDSLVKDTRNSGSVKIQADNFTVIDKDASQTMLTAAVDGAVTLRNSGDTKFNTTSTGVVVTGILTATSMVVGGLTYPTANGTDGYVLTSDGAGVVQWEEAPGAGGGISGITIQEEGSSLSTLATTLNFVGDSVTASGTGATKTITITGGGGGSSGLWASNATGINTSTNVGIATTTASAMLEIGNSGVATATTLINTKAWNGQTFNVDGNITSGSIFAVNDISGLPVIDYNASHGNLSLAPFGGNVSIGYTNSGTKLGLKGSTSERVHIVSNKLSAVTNHQINIDNGNVQYFSTTEDTAITDVDITSNNTLNIDLAVGDSITVVAILKPSADDKKISGIEIDGTAVTEQWLGGSAPDAGVSGSYDVYTFYILKTDDATFISFCNKVNFKAP